MSYYITAKEKHCATCSYWDGIRKLVQRDTCVEVEKALALGSCLEVKGAIKRYANSIGCRAYKKWNEIK